MNGHSNGANGDASETGALTGTMRVKAGLAQMLKGGVIMGEWSQNWDHFGHSTSLLKNAMLLRLWCSFVDEVGTKATCRVSAFKYFSFACRVAPCLCIISSAPASFADLRPPPAAS